MKLTAALVSLGLILAADVRARAADPRLPYASAFCGDEASVARSFIALPSANGILSDKDLAAFNAAIVEEKAPPAKIKRRLTGSTFRGGWCIAEAVLGGPKPTPVIVSGAGEFTGEGGDKLADGVSFIARPLGNAETAAALKAGTLKAPTAMLGDEDGAPIAALRTSLAARATFVGLWANRDDVILAGSAPGELYRGEKARKTFAAWKLDPTLVGDVRWGFVEGSRDQIAWAVANVQVAAAKGPPTTYRVMFVLLGDHFANDDEAFPERDTWHLVLAHFALVD